MVLRRTFRLAAEWGVTGKTLPSVRMIPDEHRRDRVLAPAEEAVYITVARSSVMHKYDDPALLVDVSTVLIDCALRPEESIWLRPENLIDDGIEVKFGKTAKARGEFR